ncbi:MAG: hypothetical protein AAGG75_01470 [Bacteroidota bacterium]
MEADFDPKDFLLFGLQHFGLRVQREEDHMVYIEQGYIVEIEGRQLYKLLQNNQVIAPFTSVEELCNFIKMDMQLNEKG